MPPKRPNTRAASSSSSTVLWPTIVTVILSVHISHLRRLIDAAYATLLEYRWYNPYSYALNFLGLRFSSPTLLFSVWPQAWLEWVEPSYRIGSAPPEEPDAPDDTQDNGDAEEDGHGDAEEGGDAEGDEDEDEDEDEDVQHENEQHLANVELTGDEPNPPDGVPAPPSPRRLRSHAKKTDPSTSQRPPVSTASTASVRDVRWRYADHAVLVTSLGELPETEASTKPSKGKSVAKSTKSATGVKSPNFATGVECVHSIWEIKPPKDEGDCSYDCMTQKKWATSHITRAHILRQLLQEAEGAFTQYPHQNVMHVFLGVGYWVRKLTMLRDNMPDSDSDFDYTTANRLRLRSYIKTSGPVFPLLNSTSTDYSDRFLRFWHEATNDAEAAAATLLS